MARAQDDKIESVDSVVEITAEAIPDPLQAAKFFLRLDRALNKNADGRVNFGYYARTWRRIYIGKAFTGDNEEELAKTLGVSVDTVKNDLRWFWDNAKAKKNGQPAINLKPVMARKNGKN